MPGTPKPERVQYQLSPGYVKNWDGKEMLREYTVNAWYAQPNSRYYRNLKFEPRTPVGEERAVS